MQPDQIAIQLWTVRDLVARDLPGTLGRLASMGYGAVELAGLAGVNPAVVRAALDASALQVVGAHVSFEALQDDLAAELDALDVIGCSLVVIPAVSPEWHGGADRVHELTMRIAEMADACAARGFALAYHNHDLEFAPLDGSTMWDLMVPSLPPSVGLEVDVYWATRAGRDPVALIESVTPRVRLLHMKDMGAAPALRDLPPGDGVLPWESIVRAGRAAGVEWYVVEQDHPIDAIDSALRGLTFLRRLSGSVPIA